MNNLTYLTQTDPLRFSLSSNQASMKAVVTIGNGGYEKLQYRDVPVPAVGPDDVLLNVLAAGVNRRKLILVSDGTHRL